MAQQRIISRQIKRAIREPWRHETREIQTLHTMIPTVLPIRRPIEILLHILRLLTLGHLAQRKIIQTVLDRPGNAARIVVPRHIAQLEPVVECASAFFRTGCKICRVECVVWCYFCILHHRCVPVCPVDCTPEAFDVGVGEDVVCVGSTLHQAVPVARSAVGKVAFVSVK